MLSLMPSGRLWDFLNLLLDDIEQGAARSLAEYEQLFPDLGEEVAREYRRTLTPPSGKDPSRQESVSTVGSYQLRKTIEEGAQGAVHLAWDSEHKREVALKFLPSQTRVLGRQRELRLRREAEALARISHPAVCTLFSTGESDGQPYLVMEYVKGVSLETLLRQPENAPPNTALRLRPEGGKELRRLLRFFLECADALHAAHLAGVVHRDVKPGNIMVREDGRPVLLDFGLAHGAMYGKQDVTQVGTTLGTPSYLAPELVDGQKPSPRSDLYSLAATMYECLCGHPVHEGENFAAVVRAIKEEPIRPLRQRNPHAPRDLEVVLACALETDVHFRYADVATFAEDVRAVLDYRPIQARRLPLWLQTVRWTQRNSALAAVLATTILALTVGFLATYRNLEREQQRLRLAEGQKYQAAAQILLERDPGGALQLSSVALRQDPSPASRATFLSALNGLYHVSLNGRSFGHHSARPIRHPGLELTAWMSSPRQVSLSHREDPPYQPRMVLDLPPGSWVGATENELGGRMAFSPNGDRLAVAPLSGEILLFDLKTQESMALEGTDLQVRCLAFHPDGQWLVSGSLDGTMAVHDSRDGRRLQGFQAHQGYLGFLQFDASGSHLVSGSTGGHRMGGVSDRTLRFWNFLDGLAHPRHTVQLEGFLSAVDYDPGREIWTYGDSSGRLSSRSTHQPEQELLSFRAPNRIHGIAISRDGRIGIGYGFNPEHGQTLETGALLLHPAEGNRVLKLTEGSTVSGITFLPKGNRIAVMGWGDTLDLYDSRSGETIWSYQPGARIPLYLRWNERHRALEMRGVAGNYWLFYLPVDICPMSAERSPGYR